jgi:hypothetical protein
MAVCYVGETWGVQRLSMGSVSLASSGMHTTHGTKTGATSVPLTKLPFGLPGRVFRSPMPFGPYDRHMPCDETTHPAGTPQRVGAARLLTN